MAPTTMVFDIGRVLIDWQPEAFFDREIGPEARARLFAEVDLYAMNLRIDHGHGLDAPIETMAARHPDWAAAIRLWRDRWPEMLAGPIQGSVDLLHRLKAAGVPVLALTNFGTETLKMAQSLFPFLNDFDRMFVSAELRLLKPDPAIYAALETAMRLPPESLFFTDDVAENTQAAAARGWHVHHFTTPERLALALSDVGLLPKD